MRARLKGLLFFTFIAAAAAAFAEEAKNPVVVVIGTRPEAIKMIPLYRSLKEAKIPAIICSTGQHAEMLEEIFSEFSIEPEVDLNIMKVGQDLHYITERVLEETKRVFREISPSLVLVQGDTTSALAAALSAYYLKIPVAHVEAGLRTNNIYAPFPEEGNRQLISRIATYNFSPTDGALNNLLREGVAKEGAFCTGNTVIDALYMMEEMIKAEEVIPSRSLADKVEAVRSSGGKLLLLTAHRRESLGEGLFQIFSAVKEALKSHSDLTIIYPMHPNPAIAKSFNEAGFDASMKIFAIPPLSYSDMVYLISNADIVATDSGGIQEEAVSLQKRTLVLRRETDRPEGLKEGLGILVGTDCRAILAAIDEYLKGERKEVKREEFLSPYGDGNAARRIAALIGDILSGTAEKSGSE